MQFAFAFPSFFFSGNLSNFSDETVDDDMYDNMESISMVEDVNASAMAPEELSCGCTWRAVSWLFGLLVK